MPAAWRTAEMRPSAPTTRGRGAGRGRPPGSARAARGPRLNGLATWAGAKIAIAEPPSTAWLRAARMWRFSIIQARARPRRCGPRRSRRYRSAGRAGEAPRPRRRARGPSVTSDRLDAAGRRGASALADARAPATGGNWRRRSAEARPSNSGAVRVSRVWDVDHGDLEPGLGQAEGQGRPGHAGAGDDHVELMLLLQAWGSWGDLSYVRIRPSRARRRKRPLTLLAPGMPGSVFEGRR